jgi:hypothetical protein
MNREGRPVKRGPGRPRSTSRGSVGSRASSVGSHVSDALVAARAEVSRWEAEHDRLLDLLQRRPTEKEKAFFLLQFGKTGASLRDAKQKLVEVKRAERSSRIDARAGGTRCCVVRCANAFVVFFTFFGLLCGCFSLNDLLFIPFQFELPAQRAPSLLTSHSRPENRTQGMSSRCRQNLRSVSVCCARIVNRSICFTDRE